MAQIETWYNQDLKRPVSIHYLHGVVFSQDNMGNVVGVNVFDNGVPASLSGTVSGSVIRSDGATVAVSGSLSGNCASIAIPQAGYAVPGVISIIIKLTTGNVVTTLCAVVANVYQTQTGTVVDPGTIIPDISELIAEIENAIGSIPADYSSLWGSIAPVFDSSRQGGYKSGEYCTYDGHFYRFKVDHSGSWSSSDVVAVNIGDELVKTDKIIRQGQTCVVTLESGSYYDSNGAMKRDGLLSRIRNVYPVSVSKISSIIIPYNYEMWIFRLDENGYYISNVGAWKTGKQNIKDIITEKTKYINFAIRKITAPDADISSEVATVESKLIYDRNASVAYETDVTVNYPLKIGQAYGAVGSAIIFSDGLAYHHTKILKNDKIKKVTFSTTYTSADVSSYIQYVDNNDIIIALDVIKNTYEIGHVYDYYPVFPAGATGMYVTCGFIDSTSRDWKLQIYKEMSIDGDCIQSEIDSKKDKYDDIIKSVNRIANGVGNFPRQSIVGFKQAYKLGFRAMLCDLRWTSDNVPVLEHDEILNGYYHDVYTENGELVSTDPPIYIAQTTYNDLLAYDFGYYKGAQFKGTKIMTFEQMLNLCKLLGCEVYIETKTNLTTEQYAIAFSLIRLYGMERQCVWNPQSLVELAELVAYEPNVYINLHTNISAGNALGDDKVNAVINAVNDYNRGHVSLTLFLGATMTETQAKALSAAGVGVMGTTLNTSAQVLEYYNQGKPYTCITSALSDGIIVGKVLFENIMRV